MEAGVRGHWGDNIIVAARLPEKRDETTLEMYEILPRGERIHVPLDDDHGRFNEKKKRGKKEKNCRGPR